MKKLQFEDVQMSCESINKIQCKYGNVFKALVIKNHTYYKDVETIITRGYYGSHNMPHIELYNHGGYDCEYDKMALNADEEILTIYTVHGTIDVLPQTDDETNIGEQEDT